MFGHMYICQINIAFIKDVWDGNGAYGNACVIYVGNKLSHGFRRI